MKSNQQKQIPDVCLILEGTFPYVSGGVSSWVYELIREHNDLSFTLVMIIPPDADQEFRYDIPENVVGMKNVVLQRLKKGKKLAKEERLGFFNSLKNPLAELLSRGRLDNLEQVLDVLKPFGKRVGNLTVLNSHDAWEMLVDTYEGSLESTSFLDFFWTWRALQGGMYSILLASLPAAKCYHSLCTGFAGLLLARAKVETGKPCLLTEHGIYTNERRIEIASADWLDDQRSLNLNIDRNRREKNLKDLWTETFSVYSRLCYNACDEIITLYEGNQELQLEEGADPEKLSIIPNGIDYPRYSVIKKDHNHPPTVALIGRVVPIKDVKTFIRAIGILRDKISEIRAFIMGPPDEDQGYFEECRELVEYSNLNGVIKFTGKVKIDDYLPRIDIIALTSLSEAQPLVLLEAGAVGIPSVATEVGSCGEIIKGSSTEIPALGDGGIICSLSSPTEIAKAIEKLLLDHPFYEACSKTIKKRVKQYYNKLDQHAAYKAVYEKYTR